MINAAIPRSETLPPRQNSILPPPAEFDSAPGAEQTRGGAENLIIPRERGRNI